MWWTLVKVLFWLSFYQLSPLEPWVSLSKVWGVLGKTEYKHEATIQDSRETLTREIGKEYYTVIKFFEDREFNLK